MKVCEKVQRKGTTSYNEVADELVSEFTNSNSHLATDSVSDERIDFFSTITKLADLSWNSLPAVVVLSCRMP